jgi:mannose-6-phosphate isomerase-like protein (cupin superfamily)
MPMCALPRSPRGDSAWNTQRFPTQTRSFPSTPDVRSPAGAEVRFLIDGESGGMIHSTLPPGEVNRATVRATVSEFWHVLAGEGQKWRRNGTGCEETADLLRGISIDIPAGTAFQYRCTGVDAPVPLHLHSALARQHGSDLHGGAVGTECCRRLTLPP